MKSLSSKYLKFVEWDPENLLKVRTKQWRVVNTDEQKLGIVKWLNRWRKYAFFPETGSAFEEDCMMDIARFVANKTQEHRSKK